MLPPTWTPGPEAAVLPPTPAAAVLLGFQDAQGSAMPPEAATLLPAQTPGGPEYATRPGLVRMVVVSARRAACWAATT